MMRKATTILLVISIAVLLTACPGLDRVLETNLYEPFAGVSAAAIKDASSDELLEMSDSDSFYETIEDPADVLPTINAAMEVAEPESAEYQELAALGAMVLLETSPAGDLMENLVAALPTLAGGEGEEEPDIAELLDLMLPASVYDGDDLDPVAFTEMIDALVAANEYYVLLGTSIGEDGYADGADISAGDIATAALVSAIVANIDPPEGTTTSEYLLLLLDPDTDPDDPDLTGGTFEMPDMESGYLANLLLAGGLDFSASADEGGTEPYPGENYASAE